MYFWIFKKYILSNKKFNKKLKIINIAIIPSSKYKLQNNIKNRFYEMIKKDFIKEVFFLHNEKKLNTQHNSMKSIGYKDFLLYFYGEKSFQDTVESTIKYTNDLFIKQTSWLKKWQNDIFFIENENKKFFLKLFNLFNKYAIKN